MASEVTFQGERDFWRYDPERRLGSPGGFGSVFEGRGSATASVAVKVIPPSPDVPKRLLFREREIAKKLGDVPGDRLIRVRDTAEVDGTLFIVMERAKESLAQFLKRHRALAEDKTILVLRDVAAGLRQLQEA